MALWVLQNTIHFGTQTMREGKTIDDTQYDVAKLRAAGAQLAPKSNAQSASQAAFASAEKLRGNADANRVGLPAWGPQDRAGQLSFGPAVTVQTLTFVEVEPDTNYFVGCQVISATGGVPTQGSLTVTTVAKATTGVTVTIFAAPGAGVTVVYDIVVTRV